MIHSFEKIPVTEDSRPFGSTLGKLDFESFGYVEEEYFFSGTANVYQEQGDSGRTVLAEEVPYRNRLLVRRPGNMDAFSGDVVVEILNATAGFDIDRMWVLTAKELMRTGAVYVGITSKPDMLDSLRLLDARRYESLSWTWEGKPPQPAAEPADPRLQTSHPERETGLFWDMLQDTAQALRTHQALIPSPRQRYLYLLGWSQSANYLTTFVRRFYDRLEQSRLFDGFLAAGNVHHFVTPLNQAGYGQSFPASLTRVERMPWPFISVQTESENAAFGGLECRQPDSDTGERKFRLYEIAGTTHDTAFSLLDYYRGDAAMARTGLTPRYVGIHPVPLDYPMEYAMYAILRHLLRWVRQGIAPPAGVCMQTGADGSNRTDAHGNALGGVRGVLLEAPLAVYHRVSQCDAALAPIPENPLFGYTEYFSREKMIRLYGDLAGYARAAAEAAAAVADTGFLLPEDAESCTAAAVAMARRILEDA